MNDPAAVILAELDRRKEVRAKASHGPWGTRRIEQYGAPAMEVTAGDGRVAVPLFRDAAHIALHACPERSAAFDQVMMALLGFGSYTRHKDWYPDFCDKLYPPKSDPTLLHYDCTCGLDAARDELERAVEKLEPSDE